MSYFDRNPVAAVTRVTTDFDASTISLPRRRYHD